MSGAVSAVVCLWCNDVILLLLLLLLLLLGLLLGLVPVSASSSGLMRSGCC